MATVTKKVGFTIEIDEEAIAPASIEVFLFQLVNRLDYEHKISSVTIDEITVPITDEVCVKDLPIGKGETLDTAPTAEVAQAEVSVKKK